MIVEDGVGCGEDAPALPGDQFRIAGTGAHEIYLIHRRDLIFRNGLTTFTPSFAAKADRSRESAAHRIPGRTWTDTARSQPRCCSCRSGTDFCERTYTHDPR